MGEVAPSASFHYFGYGIRDKDLAENKLARYLVGIRGVDFEDGNDIETDTDEGHTGVSNLDMGSYRKNAESAPTWEDKFRYSEGLEDTFYLLLGTYTVNADSRNASVFDYHFEMPPDTEEDLPTATIYNGLAKTKFDARAFDNALLNELEINFSSEDAPTISPTFVSDYNYFNLVNPTRNFPTISNFVKAPHTQVLIGEVGADEDGMVPIDCFTEASLSINHNAESQSCHGDEFGKNTKIMGSREATGSVTMPWVKGTKFFETEFEGYDKYSHKVSEEITTKQIWLKCKGGDITRISTSNEISAGERIISQETKQVEGETVTYYTISTGIPYETLIKLPECEITSVTSPKSGDEAKDLTMEFKVLEKPTRSYLTVDMVSDLEELHIDSTGITLDELYPDEAPFVTAP